MAFLVVGFMFFLAYDIYTPLTVGGVESSEIVWTVAMLSVYAMMAYTFLTRKAWAALPALVAYTAHVTFFTYAIAELFAQVTSSSAIPLHFLTNTLNLFPIYLAYVLMVPCAFLACDDTNGRASPRRTWVFIIMLSLAALLRLHLIIFNFHLTFLTLNTITNSLP